MTWTAPTAEANLSEQLYDIAAEISGCQVVIERLTNDVEGRYEQSVLSLVEAQLTRLNTRVMDIAECHDVPPLDRNAAEGRPGDSSLGEIARNGDIAMKAALEFAPSKNRTVLLEATANIIHQANRLTRGDPWS